MALFLESYRSMIFFFNLVQYFLGNNCNIFTRKHPFQAGVNVAVLLTAMYNCEMFGPLSFDFLFTFHIPLPACLLRRSENKVSIIGYGLTVLIISAVMKAFAYRLETDQYIYIIQLILRFVYYIFFLGEIFLFFVSI